ncbi:MAG: Uma2 family endonuclease [Methylococcales bacterium]
MSPAKRYHSALQIRIAIIFEQLLENGLALSKCAIKTNKGTKVADVAWVSSTVWEKIKDNAEASISPQICVEIVSTSNTQQEMSEKSQLYFETGAKEAWLCNEQGQLSFFNSEHTLIHSELAPQFPAKIDV